MDSGIIIILARLFVIGLAVFIVERFLSGLYIYLKLNIELKRRELEAWDLDDEEETEEEEEEDDDGEAWKKG
jgi:hypothetical protein